MDYEVIIAGLKNMKAAAEANLEKYRASGDARAIAAGEGMVHDFNIAIASYEAMARVSKDS